MLSSLDPRELYAKQHQGPPGRDFDPGQEGLAAAGVWALSDPAPKGKALTGLQEPLAASKQPMTLEAFLAQPQLPDDVRKDLPRFRTALESIARAAKAKGLTFLWRPTGIDTSDFDQTYPREINEILAHPYVRWGRDPKSGRWDAVVVLQGPKRV